MYPVTTFLLRCDVRIVGTTHKTNPFVTNYIEGPLGQGRVRGWVRMIGTIAAVRKLQNRYLK